MPSPKEPADDRKQLSNDQGERWRTKQFVWRHPDGRYEKPFPEGSSESLKNGEGSIVAVVTQTEARDKIDELASSLTRLLEAVEEHRKTGSYESASWGMVKADADERLYAAASEAREGLS